VADFGAIELAASNVGFPQPGGGVTVGVAGVGVLVAVLVATAVAPMTVGVGRIEILQLP
jgi:hypothetical protein